MALKHWPCKPALVNYANSLSFGLLLLGLFSPLAPVKAQVAPPMHEQASAISQTPVEVILLRRAIIGQESGANFRAVNPHSGALGYGQVMPENVPSWSREALGYSISARQFLANPQIQLYIIDHKLNQYWQRALTASGGDRAIAIQRVAAQWYSGRPELYTSTRPQFYAGHPYPSIAHYAYAVLRRYAGLQQVMLANQAFTPPQPVIASSLPNSEPVIATPTAATAQATPEAPTSIFGWSNFQLSNNPLKLENEYARNSGFTL
jgi:hypothetical protein